MGLRSLIIYLFLLILDVAAGVWCALESVYWGAGAALTVAGVLVYMLISLYSSNLDKLNYLLSAFENGDLTFHFTETSGFLKDRVFNILLNRVRKFVSDQQQLRNDSEAFHRGVENLSRTGLLGVGSKGDVRCYNKSLASVFGLQTLRSVSELDRIVPGIVSRLESMPEDGRLEIPVGSEMRIYHFIIEMKTVTDGNEPVRIYVFNEKEDSNQEQSENAQWQKMTRIISHEVLNTITPIVSLSDTLLGMTQDRNVREGLVVIGESARGLLGFVNGYRALSRVPVPQIHPFKFRPMLDYVLSPLLPALESMGGHAEVHLEDEDMVLFADEQLMRQVVGNILKNAINALKDRFGDGGCGAGDAAGTGPACSPVIRITAFVNASDNTEIHISNNGVPIPPENADHIFDPFFTTRAEGTGVGLALSRQIMRAHAGSIRLDRTDPEFTTFVLTL